MKFVIAPDSFKESMTAKAAAVAIQAGLQKIYPDADYELVPMADGGEGTVQSLVCLLYTSPSPRDGLLTRMPSSA